MTRPLRVLIVEDEEGDALLLIAHLRRGGYQPEWARVDTPEAMADALDREPWNVVLSDYSMPRFSGPAALALLREKGLDLPFILVSGVMGEEAAVAALRSGAHDYILKGNLARLIPAIEREMGDAENRGRQRAAEEALRRYELLSAYSRDIILFIRREDGRILEANAAAAEAYGYSREELLGLTIQDLRAPETQALTLGQMAAADARGVLFETIHRRRDGTTFPVEVSSRGATVDGARTLLSVVRDITERRRAEDELIRAKEEWERTFDAVPDLIALVDTKHRIIRANRAMEERLRVAPGYVAGLPCYECVHGSPDVPAACPHSQTLLDGKEHVAEIHEDHLGGDFLVSTTPLCDEQGRLLGSVHVARDITERKRVEQALRESEERFRQLANAMPQLVWSARPDGTVDYYNERAKEFRGISQDASGNWQWAPVLHPDDVERTVNAWEEAVRTGTTYQVAHRVQGADRTYRWHLSRGVPARDEQGRITRWYGTATDIDDQKGAEERFRFLAEASRVLATSLGFEETLDRVAWLAVPAMADWCFVDLLESPGRLHRVAVAYADPEKASLARAFKRDYPARRDVPRGVSKVLRTRQTDLLPEVDDAILQEIARDAEHLELMRGIGIRSFLSVPILARGELLGAITFVRTQEPGYNASDQDLAEELARRAAAAIENARLYRAAVEARGDAEEANQAKDRFVAMVSHELRNPLSAIQAGIALLQRTILEDPRSARALEIVERNTRLQTRLVNDLLDLSRLQRGKLQLQRAPMDVANVVLAAEQASAAEMAEAGLTLTCDTEAGLWVDGDFDRLQQVVGNLLTNAAKFTPAGGRVELRAAQCGDCVCVSVQDTGIGIEPEQLSGLFRIFYQGEVGAQRKPGLGLGLSLVKGIVERHGGRVWAESEGAGRGSRFTVSLPLVEKPMLKAQGSGGAGLNPEPRTLNPLRVLLVEDNRDTLAMVEEDLKARGYEVHAAASAEDALELLRRVTPDVILSDIRLPGLSGYEFLRRARELPGVAGVPAFAVTAYGGEEDVRRAKEAGFIGHFTKPVDLASLDRRIRELLGAAGEARQ